jgi:RNA polymerase sigma factor (sigma-70 family)
LITRPAELWPLDLAWAVDRLAAMDDALTSQSPYLRALAMRFHEECAAAGLGTDDLAQETLLRAATATLPSRSSDRQRYLHRIMANLLHDRLAAANALKRGGGRVCSLDALLEGMTESTRRIESLLPAPGPGPRTVAQRREVQARVTVALGALPPPQRAAITLHLVHEFTLEETAAALECSEGRVRGLLQRGRQTLRRSLAELWEDATTGAQEIGQAQAPA